MQNYIPFKFDAFFQNSGGNVNGKSNFNKTLKSNLELSEKIKL
jgi:hypothetical protein